MGGQTSGAVILADRNMASSDGLRGLLETEFESVFVVADKRTLRKGMERLAPRVIVLDASFGLEWLPGLVRDIQLRSPESKVIILSLHDEPVTAQAFLAAGAHAVVLKRRAGTDLFAALEAVACGKAYVSPDLGPDALDPGPGRDQVS